MTTRQAIGCELVQAARGARTLTAQCPRRRHMPWKVKAWPVLTLFESAKASTTPTAQIPWAWVKCVHSSCAAEAEITNIPKQTKTREADTGTGTITTREHKQASTSTRAWAREQKLALITVTAVCPSMPSSPGQPASRGRFNSVLNRTCRY